MRPTRPKVAAATPLGVVMALFLLSGRWNLERVVAIDGSAFTAPRVWLVAAVLFVALMPLIRPRRDVLPPVGLLTFVGYFLMTALWAPDSHLASQKAIDLLVMTLGILSLRRLTAHVGIAATTRRLWEVFAVTFGAFALVGLASSLLGGGGRLSVLGGGPNVYGRNMGVLLVVCLGAMLDNGRARGWPLAGVLVAGLLVVLTGSRGALGGTLVGVASLLFMRRIQPGRTLVAVTFSAVGLAALVRWTAVGRAALESFQQRVIVLTLQQNYDSGRGPLRDAAFDMITRNPWFGDGLNGFRARGHGVYPHNLELEALTDGGLVGLAVLAVALAVPLVAIAVRSRKVDPATAAVFLLHLACAQVSGDFYDSRGVFLFGMLLTLQFTVRRPQRRARPKPAAREDPYR
jgi:O-antigen ligase